MLGHKFQPMVNFYKSKMATAAIMEKGKMARIMSDT